MVDMVYRLDPEIIIGHDSVNRIGKICDSLGGRVLVVTEQVLYEGNAIGRLCSVLENSGISAIVFDEISALSTAEAADRAVSLASGARCNVVMGFGGLKTQSIARMTAMAAVSRTDIFELLDGSRKEEPFLPFIAVPAVDQDPFMFARFLIALDPRDRSVKQIKSPPGLCKAAVIDGSLFPDPLSGKFASTAAFDGFCTAIEAYCSTKASFLSDALLEQAISIYSGLIKSQSGNYGPDLAEGVIKGALLVALGSSISSPGIGTALAYALNGKFPVAKSWCSTVILPYILEKLAAAKPEKMAKAAALMGEAVEGSSIAEAAGMVADTIRHLMGIHKVPARLKEFNLSLDRLVPAAESARDLEFVTYSPWIVASENAFDILKMAY